MPTPDEQHALFAQAFSGPQPPEGFNTPLTPQESVKFAAWKAKNAPKDSGADYDLHGAFKAGVIADSVTGHWPDTFKKPNHPTFSVESQYAPFAPHLAGTWGGPKHDQFIPPPPIDLATGLPLTPDTMRGNAVDPNAVGAIPAADYTGNDFGKAGTFNPVRTPR